MANLATTKTKDASTPNDESLLQKAARIIPGFTPSTSTAGPVKKTRSRKAKTSSISAPVHGTGAPIGKEGAGADSLAPTAEGTGAEEPQDEGDEAVETKKTSAVEATSKRIRAANKKLVSRCFSSPAR